LAKVTSLNEQRGVLTAWLEDVTAAARESLTVHGYIDSAGELKPSHHC